MNHRQIQMPCRRRYLLNMLYCGVTTKKVTNTKYIEFILAK